MSPRPKIGLALGGGGARSLAHIGVLKVLELAGIPIDAITGSSMGGFVAAAYAAGLSPAEMEAEALRMAHPAEMVKMMDLSPFRRGLLQGKHIREYLEKLIGADRTFDSLRIPLAVTAVDLRLGKPLLLREGSVIDAVLATCTVPGLLPPVPAGEALLVDGGLLDNVPVEAACQLGAERVIAVVAAPDYPRETPPPNPHPLPDIVPDFLEDFYQAVLIMAAGLTRERLKDSCPEIVLRPAIPDNMSLLGFTQAAEAIAAGEAAAQAALPQIATLSVIQSLCDPVARIHTLDSALNP